MLMEKVAEIAPDKDDSLEEQLGLELRCESRAHHTNAKHHDSTEPASVRGVAPCGRTMNICATFAAVIMTRGVVVRCQCGGKHFAKSFTFVNI